MVQKRYIHSLPSRWPLLTPFLVPEFPAYPESFSCAMTGKSDIPLTKRGEEIIADLGPRIVGPGKLLDPAHIQYAFISPRQRAEKTFDLLFQHSEVKPPQTIEQDIQEWDYGEYEGRLAGEIRKNSDPKWDIWVDGCPGGESAAEMTARADRMVARIVEIQQAHHEGEDQTTGDVVIFSHGHFTRVFLTRWLGLPLTNGRLFSVDPGAVSIGGYAHSNFEEKALLGLNLFGEL